MNARVICSDGFVVVYFEMKLSEMIEEAQA
jgi:hypothetical protein